MLTFSKPTFLGIDFGMSHIKAVELTLNNERPYLINYGEASVDLSDTQNSASQTQNQEERIVTIFLALLQKMAPKAKSVYVAMPGFSGLITLIELPKMDKADLDAAVRFEAQKYVPSPMEEVVLSWDIVSGQPSTGTMIDNSTTANAAGNTEVLLVAALHKEVEKYEKYIAASELKMEVLELETFSLARALAQESDGTVLIIDIGSRSTNLVLVENGVIKINRNLNAGGYEITTTLSEALNITWERADMIKSGDKDFLNSRESVILIPSLELVVNESKRMLAAYKEKYPDVHIDNVILSGGSSKMKGLDVYIKRMLNIPVMIGDPWREIDYDVQLEDIVPRLGAAYSVSVGLALAGIEAYDRS